MDSEWRETQKMLYSEVHIKDSRLLIHRCESFLVFFTALSSWQNITVSELSFPGRQTWPPRPTHPKTHTHNTPRGH